MKCSSSDLMVRRKIRKHHDGGDDPLIQLALVGKQRGLLSLEQAEGIRAVLKGKTLAPVDELF